jgi:hypothetical protein
MRAETLLEQILEAEQVLQLAQQAQQLQQPQQLQHPQRPQQPPQVPRQIMAIQSRPQATGEAAGDYAGRPGPQGRRKPSGRGTTSLLEQLVSI